MKTGFLLVSFSAAGALATGCGSLSAYPGNDYRVDVAKPEVQLVQQVGTYNLEFTLAGCDDFVADVSVNNGERHTVDAKPLGNGRFAATLPIDFLHHDDAFCVYDTERPQKSGAQLQVTCRQDGRVAVTNFAVSWAPAWRASSRRRGPVDAVFAGPSPDRFYEVGSGWLDAVVTASEHGPETEATSASSRPPLLVESPHQTVRLWSACPINDCGKFYFVDTPTEKSFTEGDIVQVFNLDGDRLSFVRNVIAPPDALDFVSEGNDSVLLSQTSDDTVLTRVTDESATVIGKFAGETLPTKLASLDGAHVFLAYTTAGKTRLRRSDGTLVAEVPTPGAGTVSQLSLAPTGDAWITLRGGQAWISTLDRSGATPSATATLLPSALERLTDPSGDGHGLGVAWTTSGVVLTDSTGLELYERSAPFARRWNGTLDARSVVGVGESVVVLTATGVQMFDAAGHPTGGTDPIDPSCRLTQYEPQHLAVIGPDLVALAGRSATYQFKVGAVTTEVSR